MSEKVSLSGADAARLPQKKKLFVLYDERAMSGDTDDAAVLSCADSLKEAKRDKRRMFPTAVIVEYDVEPAPKPGEPDALVHEVILYGE